VTALSTRGTACVFSSNPTDVVVDVFGAVPEDGFAPVSPPVRLADTRPLGTTDGAYDGVGRLAGTQTMEVPIAGRAGVPDDATTVVLNVTVDRPELAGFVAVWSCRTARPVVSNVNFAAAQTISNLVVSDLSATGSVCIYSNVATEVVVDVFATITP
jgi:hypothetical protein